MKKRKGETVERVEWGDKGEKATVWKKTACGMVTVEVLSPEALGDEDVNAALRLARKVAAEIVDE